MDWYTCLLAASLVQKTRVFMCFSVEMLENNHLRVKDYQLCTITSLLSISVLLIVRECKHTLPLHQALHQALHLTFNCMHIQWYAYSMVCIFNGMQLRFRRQAHEEVERSLSAVRPDVGSG
jgi:hypothetical protein